MTNHPNNNKPPVGLAPLFLLLALLLPTAVYRIAVEPGAGTLGWAAVPFAWYGMALVASAATLPLLYFTAMLLLHRRTPDSHTTNNNGMLRWSVLAGTAFALVGLAVGPGIGVELARLHLPLLVRTIACSALTMFVQLPWCIALAALLWARTPTQPLQFARGSLLLSLALAIVLPWMHAIAVVDRESKETAELLQRGKLVQAYPRVVALAELGSSHSIVGAPPPRLQLQLAADLSVLREQTTYPLPTDATAEQIFQRARQLAMLNRADEAIALLETLADLSRSDAKRKDEAPARLQATLLMAAIRQDQQSFDASNAHYKNALDRLLSRSDPDPQLLVKAYSGLAYNARALGKPLEAENYYHKALEKVPTQKAYFHFQLGQHYRLGGRPHAALEHLKLALHLDPTLAAQARPLLTELHAQTPGCLLRWTGK